MAKKILIPVIITLLLVCIGFVTAAVYIYTQMSAPPFIVSSERMQKEYLRNLKTIGEYKVITGVEENPRENETEIVVYFSKSGKQSGASSENFVAIGMGKDRVTEIIRNIDKSSCSPRAQTRGGLGNVAYYRGSCGRSSYYIFVDGESWIVFNAEDGVVGLEAMIKGYL